MYERIVIALDGSPLAEQILPHAEALAEKFGSTVILVRAILPVAQVAAMIEPAAAGVALDPTLIEQTIETEEEEAAGYLNSVATSLRLKGVHLEAEHPEGAAVDVILDCARRHQADLIGMTTHGRGGLAKLIWGSVSEAVLKQAVCPILLVRVKSPS
ncbi:MAG TPA: universal stress protein [Chloroflexota bacterium]|jgi:nucleotide-binding universal stress UspA family protein|nr:universal stress protein [Chloroflexota bacterium]